jgi:hypothetical protein
LPDSAPGGRQKARTGSGPLGGLPHKRFQ